METLSPEQLSQKLKNRAGSIGLAPTPVIPSNPLGRLRQKYRVIAAGFCVLAVGNDPTHYRYDVASAPEIIAVGDLLSAECVYFPTLSSIRFEERKP
jgi:hypothetical protein